MESKFDSKWKVTLKGVLHKGQAFVKFHVAAKQLVNKMGSLAAKMGRGRSLVGYKMRSLATKMGRCKGLKNIGTSSNTGTQDFESYGASKECIFRLPTLYVIQK